MMRKLILILIFILCIAFPVLADIVNVGDGTSNPMYFSVVPYNGTYNIDMRADYYPQYVKGQKNPVWNRSTVSMQPAYSVSGYNMKYWDSQMIGAVSIYNIPRTVTKDGRQYSITNSNDVVIKVTTDCASGFNFVSQSSPTIVRPFGLYGEAKFMEQTKYANVSSGVNAVSGSNSNADYDPNLIFFTPPYDNTWRTDDFAEKIINRKVASSNYFAFWLDLIISLPFDKDSITNSGVMIGGAQYPLIDANDYCALVYVKGEMSIVYHADDNSGDTYDFSYTVNLPIPFSGYSNVISEHVEDKAAVYITTTTANINLNRESTGRWIDIGSIDLMQNFLTGDRVINPDESKGNPVSRIFFSASPDPFTQNSAGFRFIHNNAGNVLTSNNSIRFYLRFEGSGDSAREGITYYDGKGYTFSSDMMNISGSYVTSTCISNQYILHTEKSKRQMHFHSLSGDISILVDDNPDTMRAGTYYGNVYMHIVVDDLR